MYSMTDVALTDPVFTTLMADLSRSLAKTQEDEFSSQDAEPTGLLIALVAWHEGKPVGCGVLRREDAGRAEIRRLYSTKPGVGRALVQAFTEHAQQHHCVSLVAAVRIMNGKAVNFFLHQGFKKCTNYGKYRYSSQSICLEKLL